MKFSIVLRYCGDFAAQLNILVCNAAHLIKRLDIPGLNHPPPPGLEKWSILQNHLPLLSRDLRPLPTDKCVTKSFWDKQLFLKLDT